ncbi:hypothetical protein IWQ60_008282 [Tieghemiomyces parasiticus]|uniref:Uncharacterized protein n=1 Tax=Tieghemiomyces parasiticus TaxID=78921 RepID=A0A9W8DM07_9FUNG|nr:hypothetical protein IWQ60_008282 [Tieghemiomyces parasiticus]
MHLTPTLPQRTSQRWALDKRTPASSSARPRDDSSSHGRPPVSPAKGDLVSHVFRATEPLAVPAASETKRLEAQRYTLDTDITSLRDRIAKETRTVEGLRKLFKAQEANSDSTWQTQQEINLCENRLLSLNKEADDKGQQLLQVENEVQRHYLAVLRQQVAWHQDMAQSVYGWTSQTLVESAEHTPVANSPREPKVQSHTATEEGPPGDDLNDSGSPRVRQLQHRVQQLAVELFQTQEELSTTQAGAQRLRAERDGLLRHVQTLQRGLDLIFLYTQESYTVSSDEISYRDHLDQLFTVRDRASFMTVDSGMNETGRPLSFTGSNWSAGGGHAQEARISQLIRHPNDTDPTLEDPAQLTTTSRQFALRLYDSFTKCRNDVVEAHAQLKAKSQYFKILHKFVDLHDLDAAQPNGPSSNGTRYSVPSARLRTSMEEEMARDTHLFEWFNRRTPSRPSGVSVDPSRPSGPGVDPPSGTPTMGASTTATAPAPRQASAFKQLRRQISTVLRPGANTGNGNGAAPSSPARNSAKVDRKKPGGQGGWLFRQRSLLSMGSHSGPSARPSMQDHHPMGQPGSGNSSKRHTVASTEMDAVQLGRAIRGSTSEGQMRSGGRVTYGASGPHSGTAVLPPLHCHPDFTVYDSQMGQRVGQLENAIYERDTVISELSAQVHDLTLNLDHIQSRHLKVVRPIKSLFYQLPAFLPETTFVPPRALTEWIEREQESQRTAVMRYIEGPTATLEPVTNTSPPVVPAPRSSLQLLGRNNRASMEPPTPVIGHPTPVVDTTVQTTTVISNRTPTTLTLTTTSTWNPQAVRHPVRHGGPEPTTMTTDRILDLDEILLPDQLPRFMFSFAEFVERIDTLIQENASLRNRVTRLELVRSELDQVREQLYQDRETLIVEREQLYADRERLWQERHDLLAERSRRLSTESSMSSAAVGAGPARPLLHRRASDTSVAYPASDAASMASSSARLTAVPGVGPRAILSRQESEVDSLIDRTASPRDLVILERYSQTSSSLSDGPNFSANSRGTLPLREDEDEDGSVVRPTSAVVAVRSTGSTKPVIMDITSPLLRRPSHPLSLALTPVSAPAVPVSPVESGSTPVVAKPTTDPPKPDTASEPLTSRNFPSTATGRKRSSTVTPFLNLEHESRHHIGPAAAYHYSHSHLPAQTIPLSELRASISSETSLSPVGVSGSPRGSPRIRRMPSTSTPYGSVRRRRPSAPPRFKTVSFAPVAEAGQTTGMSRYPVGAMSLAPISLGHPESATNPASSPQSLSTVTSPALPPSATFGTPAEALASWSSPDPEPNGAPATIAGTGKSSHRSASSIPSARRFSDGCLLESRHLPRSPGQDTFALQQQRGFPGGIPLSRQVTTDSLAATFGYMGGGSRANSNPNSPHHRRQSSMRNSTTSPLPTSLSGYINSRRSSTAAPLFTLSVSKPDLHTALDTDFYEGETPDFTTSSLLDRFADQDRIIRSWHSRLEKEARRLDQALRMMELEDSASDDESANGDEVIDNLADSQDILRDVGFDIRPAQ